MLSLGKSQTWHLFPINSPIVTFVTLAEGHTQVCYSFKNYSCLVKDLRFFIFGMSWLKPTANIQTYTAGASLNKSVLRFHGVTVWLAWTATYQEYLREMSHHFIHQHKKRGIKSTWKPWHFLSIFFSFLCSTWWETITVSTNVGETNRTQS